MVTGGKRKAEVSTEIEDQQVTKEDTEVKQNKKQRLMTEYLIDQREVENDTGRTQKVQVQSQVLDDEVKALRDQIMDDKMARRGVKAMERSQRNKKKARERFNRYTTSYRHLAATGDKAMVKAWRKANKIREKWMEPERLLTIPEEEEPPQSHPMKHK